MPRSHALTLWALIPVLGLSGCESDTFMPPPNPELTAPAPPPPVRVVEMILPTNSTPDQNALAQYLRLVASREKTSYRTSAPEPNDPPRRQADLIRKAAERGATVLIVQPAQDAEVTKALHEVRAQGVSSVLLAEPLSEAGTGKPFPIVEPAPYSDAAGKIIETAVEAAKTVKLPADGTAVILTVLKPDADLKAGAEALAAALKKAGVAHSEPLTYDGTLEGAKSALNTRLEADPKLAIVLIGEQVGLTGALDVRSKLKGKRPIVVAGYVPSDPPISEMLSMQTAAMAVRNIPQLARQAFKTALQVAEGDAVPDRTAVPDDVRRFASAYVDTPPDPMEGLPKSD
ncbi:ABC-type sugar transport system, substrate-binding protein, contains N-terminal xre family HTH domain [Singulisphaera sp. GP187]|uniref:substrate-binding domain-containing protein n=1 Tax=Singulisphaera sp. GP187 TaxID=1882752 RepID=UPI0009266BC1|nr:substrate-binding domain-containing protein [Singulisphaera sp. GP187]SIO45792.1 ABC-type sugar transport system, substrate-binding protein, contains N-terminal xre family HTH domain [Singulisphaera sp. GP187]